MGCHRLGGTLCQFQQTGQKIHILKYAAETAGAKTRPCRLNDGYMSLNWSTTPSILLELGYMSNPEEDVLLGKPEYQALLAESIAQGLVEYFN